MNPILITSFQALILASIYLHSRSHSKLSPNCIAIPTVKSFQIAMLFPPQTLSELDYNATSTIMKKNSGLETNLVEHQTKTSCQG